MAEAERWHREFGLNHRALDATALQEMEPHLAPVLAGALHWTDPTSVDDPQGLAQAYLRRFEHLGGRFVQGNASNLEAHGTKWRLQSAQGVLEADATVIEAIIGADGRLQPRTRSSSPPSIARWPVTGRTVAAPWAVSAFTIRAWKADDGS